MIEQARQKPTSESGFTLLELLVAMTLLGLIFAAIAGGLRFGTQAWRVSAERQADNEQLQVVATVLRRQLEGALDELPKIYGESDTALFEGRREWVRFYGRAPARSMPPGAYRLEFSLAPDGRRHALVLGWRNLGDRNIDLPGQKEPIARGILGLEFSYFGDPDSGNDPKWTNEWHSKKELPLAIRLNIRKSNDDQGLWPEIVIPIHPRLRRLW